jgi:hypothetical protein
MWKEKVTLGKKISQLSHASTKAPKDIVSNGCFRVVINNTVNREIRWQNYLAQDEHLTKKSLEATTEHSQMDEPMLCDPILHENLQKICPIVSRDVV